MVTAYHSQITAPVLGIKKSAFLVTYQDLRGAKTKVSVLSESPHFAEQDAYNVLRNWGLEKNKIRVSIEQGGCRG